VRIVGTDGVAWGEMGRAEVVGEGHWRLVAMEPIGRLKPRQTSTTKLAYPNSTQLGPTFHIALCTPGSGYFK